MDSIDDTHPSAREVLTWLNKGRYPSPDNGQVDIRVAVDLAVRGTRLYTDEELCALVERSPEARSDAPDASTRIEVLDATTQVSAHLLTAVGDVALLNFASARSPGGGFLRGARAQEEDLCRCSALYASLLSQPRYYEVNRAHRSALYTDHLIYSPRVPFFRTASEATLLSAPFVASVITAPAPNAGALMQREPRSLAAVPATFARRWRNVLAVAESHGHHTLVLGAWGAGAFRNDPLVVATQARDALTSQRFARSFRHVVFAIPDRGAVSSANLARFRDVFDR
jgi:uncharacterized protein (TIGR02452 family)